MKPKPRPPPEPNLDDFRQATRVLEAVLSDRSLLSALPDEERRALLMAAGRVARPLRNEVRGLVKALRKQRRRTVALEDRRRRGATAIREARAQAVFAAPAQLPENARRPAERLGQPRHCYVCKAEYRALHFFYDALCPACGDENYARRHPTARLDGQWAVITGARLKIGYQAALMMLRAGAGVVVTTRFPHDAALRYAREPDFEAWSGRLQVHGLDLRHSPSVELFGRYLEATLPRLDILINNAAQTVRRPVGFYEHLMAQERSPVARLPASAQSVLASRGACVAALTGRRAQLPGQAPSSPDITGLSTWHAGGAGVGIVASAELSQVRYTYEDASYGMDVFPAGEVDADLQQVDLRTMNSWRLSLAQVPTPELLEVQLVNAVAPFILAARLKPLMLKGPRGPKHVVNVSAMEGSFSRGTKTDKHPHTNMAKAALNMMTLTSAPDFARDDIYMNAVDTGWVTDEDPAQHAVRKREELDFQPPLDIVDGAARVLDPVFQVALGRPPWVGAFLKDYRPTAW